MESLGRMGGAGMTRPDQIWGLVWGLVLETKVGMEKLSQNGINQLPWENLVPHFLTAGGF